MTHYTHCFPDALAPKALGLDQTTRFCRAGTLRGLFTALGRDGIDKFVLNIATNPYQQDKVNEFAASINRHQNRVYSFGSLHPD